MNGERPSRFSLLAAWQQRLQAMPAALRVLILTIVLTAVALVCLFGCMLIGALTLPTPGL